MTDTGVPAPFRPPAYPYDRLDDLRAEAARFDGGAIDLSVGAPVDPVPAAITSAMATADARGYPPSHGSSAMREAASRWMARRLGVDIDSAHVRACVGTKEFVAGLPHLLRLRDPSRDTVLYPEISYPSYAMGATLAGCRAVPVPVNERWQIDLRAVDHDDADRALCLWVNTPGNPAGGLDDLGAVAEWGRRHGVPVFSDECYVEFTWDGPPRTILSSGVEGVVAVHSLSKRSSFAGGRAGFYAGDSELVTYLAEVRKHAGLMDPAPMQAAAVAALDDDEHVDLQRERYQARLRRGIELFAALGLEPSMPGGAFYLWMAAPDGDGWGLTRRLADDTGVIVSPGEFYGAAGAGHVRAAMVVTDTTLDVLAGRVRKVSA